MARHKRTPIPTGTLVRVLPTFITEHERGHLAEAGDLWVVLEMRGSRMDLYRCKSLATGMTYAWFREEFEIGGRDG